MHIARKSFHITKITKLDMVDYMTWLKWLITDVAFSTLDPSLTASIDCDLWIAEA